MAQYVESVELPPASPHETAPQIENEAVASSWLDSPAWVNAEVEVSVATYQAYQTLYYAFIALLGLAGLDKFLHVLKPWDAYVAPGMASFFHLSAGAIAIFAGLIELSIALLIALKPRIGSWAATAWFGLIVINLLTIPGYYDMVLITLALAAAGFAFTRLSAECN